MDMRMKWVVFEEATPLGFRFFVHVSIFQILDIQYIQIPSKKIGLQRSPNNFSAHKACTFFLEKNLAWAWEVQESLEENDRTTLRSG